MQDSILKNVLQFKHNNLGRNKKPGFVTSKKLGEE